MNWDAIGSVGEIAGAIGVIASLAYLAFETRKNTKSIRASLSNETLVSVAELNDLILDNPELRRVLSKAQNPSLSVDDFDTNERDIVIYLARALFMRYEGVYLLFRQGLVEEELWYQRRAAGAGVLQIPIFQHYWEKEKHNSIYTNSFIDTMNTATAAELRAPISVDPEQP